MVTVAIDIDTWQSEKLCEQRQHCNPPLGQAVAKDVAGDCTAMDTHVAILFHVYMALISVAVTEVSILFTFFASRLTWNRPVVASLDWLSLERGVAGVVFWMACLILDGATVLGVSYRIILLNILTSGYSDALYPQSQGSTSMALVACMATAALLPLGTSIYGSYTRITSWQTLQHYSTIPEIRLWSPPSANQKSRDE